MSRSAGREVPAGGLTSFPRSHAALQWSRYSRVRDPTRTPAMPRSDRQPAPRVLNVGQCGFDHRTIATSLGRQFGAVVERADTLDEVRDALGRGRFDLVLVNRVL